jgi:hypothetical protein
MCVSVFSFYRHVIMKSDKRYDLSGKRKLASLAAEPIQRP